MGGFTRLLTTNLPVILKNPIIQSLLGNYFLPLNSFVRRVKKERKKIEMGFKIRRLYLLLRSVNLSEFLSSCACFDKSTSWAKSWTCHKCPRFGSFECHPQSARVPSLRSPQIVPRPPCRRIPSPAEAKSKYLGLPSRVPNASY